MSLIDNDLSKLKSIVRECADEGVYSFPMPIVSLDSYYIDYADSRHLGGVLTEFDSEKIRHLRDEMDKMWSGNTCIKKIIPVIISAYMKLYDSETKIKDVDLYNYMM